MDVGADHAPLVSYHGRVHRQSDKQLQGVHIQTPTLICQGVKNRH